jgi:hypothetical protein
MSTPTNDGGPAFPEPFVPKSSGLSINMHPGMSLRAYIATKAMQSIIGLTTSGDAAKYNHDDLQAATARAACGYADALIAELGKGGK